MVFEFPAKGGIDQVRRIEDPELCRVLTNLRRAAAGEERLFGYWDGRDWRDVRSDEVNDYLRDASGGEMTAKDFRTWHATVLAATELATAGAQRSVTARRRAVAAVMREVAELLGNTPTVARASYVDPRVVDLYHDGVVAPVRPGDAPRGGRAGRAGAAGGGLTGPVGESWGEVATGPEPSARMRWSDRTWGGPARAPVALAGATPRPPVTVGRTGRRWTAGACVSVCRQRVDRGCRRR